MIDEKRRNELGDELEIKLMKERVLPNALLDDFEFEHRSRNEHGVDFLIKEKFNGRWNYRIAIECKNWGDEIPTPEQIKELILDRFKDCPPYVLKILIGHVSFSEEQRYKYLTKNGIYYYDVGKQVLPEDLEVIKEEYVQKLIDVVAWKILIQTGKYREDFVTPMRVEIIGDNEVLFESPNRVIHRQNLKNRESIRSRGYGHKSSDWVKIGKKPLDLAWWGLGNDETGINFLSVPKRYEIHSKTTEFYELVVDGDYEESSRERIRKDLEEQFVNFAKLPTEMQEDFIDMAEERRMKEIYELAGIDYSEIEKFDKWKEKEVKRNGLDIERQGLMKFLRVITWKRQAQPSEVVGL